VRSPTICPVCRSDAVVAVGPLKIIAPGLELRELPGEQCTLCGHLGVQIPQPWLVRLYPPDVAHITVARRERLRWRQSRRSTRR
jgi:hypothetical protein